MQIVCKQYKHSHFQLTEPGVNMCSIETYPYKVYV